MVTTFRLGRACTSNPLVVHNALDILHRLLPTIQLFEGSSCIALGILSLCTFASFKAAKQLVDKGAPTSLPSYSLFYRNYMHVVNNVSCLRERRHILRAQKYKYNV